MYSAEVAFKIRSRTSYIIDISLSRFKLIAILRQRFKEAFTLVNEMHLHDFYVCILE